MHHSKSTMRYKSERLGASFMVNQSPWQKGGSAEQQMQALKTMEETRLEAATSLLLQLGQGGRTVEGDVQQRRRGRQCNDSPDGPEDVSKGDGLRLRRTAADGLGGRGQVRAPPLPSFLPGLGQGLGVGKDWCSSPLLSRWGRGLGPLTEEQGTRYSLCVYCALYFVMYY